MTEINHYSNKIIDDIKNKKNDTIKKLRTDIEHFSICNLPFSDMFFNNIDYIHWDFNFIVEYAHLTNINNEIFWQTVISSPYHSLTAKLDIYHYILDNNFLSILNNQANQNRYFIDDFLKSYDLGIYNIITDDAFRDEDEKRLLLFIKKLIDCNDFHFSSYDIKSILYRKRTAFMIFPYFLEKAYTNMNEHDQNFILSNILKIVQVDYPSSLYFPYTTLFDNQKIKKDEYRNKILNFIFKKRKNKKEPIVMHDEIPYFHTEKIWLLILKKFKKHTPGFKSDMIKNLKHIITTTYSTQLLQFYIDNGGDLYSEDKNDNELFIFLSNKLRSDLFGKDNIQFEFAYNLSNEKSLEFFHHIINNFTDEEKAKSISSFLNEWRAEILTYKNNVSSELLGICGLLESMKIYKSLEDFNHEEKQDLINKKKRI